MKIYPIKLKNVLKDIIWGGTTLSDEYGLAPKGTRIAEAWTLTLRPDGENIIENGEFAGKSIKEYAECIGMEALCGKEFACKDIYEFPLLVKLIDAKDNLSVQVHPDDKYALENEGEYGKTEMWYIVDCEPGGQLVYGLNEGTDITSDDFVNAAKGGNISEYLNYVDVKKGDIYYIPAGMVHAIGKGILIAEVQQNSNSTFRIYDYGRVGADGKPRELHLDKALAVIKTDFSHDHAIGGLLPTDISGMPVKIVESEFFSVSKLILSNGESCSFEKNGMTHILCIEGFGTLSYKDATGEVVSIDVKAAESVLVPSECAKFEILCENTAEFLVSTSK